MRDAKERPLSPAVAWVIGIVIGLFLLWTSTRLLSPVLGDAPATVLGYIMFGAAAAVARTVLAR